MEPWMAMLIGIGFGYFLANLDALVRGLVAFYLTHQISKAFITQAQEKENKDGQGPGRNGE